MRDQHGSSGNHINGKMLIWQRFQIYPRLIRGGLNLIKKLSVKHNFNALIGGHLANAEQIAALISDDRMIGAVAHCIT